MNKTIVFKRNKILNKGGRKFLYSIEDSGLYEIDDKIEQILALSGHTINELFIKLVKEKNMEVEEINNLLQMIYSAGLVLDSNSSCFEDDGFKDIVERFVNFLILPIVMLTAKGDDYG